MRMPGCPIIRSCATAAWILGGLGASVPAGAVTLDFEAAAYQADRTIHEVDGWTLSSVQGGLPEAFRILAESGDKSLRASTSGINTVFKDIKDLPAGFQHLDLQWEWRASEPAADACLGASAANDNARAATRALACFHAGGRVTLATALGLEVDAQAHWTSGVRYTMRMRMDLLANTYSLYMGADSLRADEILVAGPVAMAGAAAAPPARLVVRTENGAGSVDVDDIAWENVVYWLGGGDGLASTAGNWTGGSAPDSQTQAVFDARAAGAVAFDRPMAVRSVTIERGFAYAFNLGAATLSVGGKADFTGLKSAAQSTGALRMAAPRAQSLIGPEAVALPPLLHDGAGVLRLDGRRLLVQSLAQTAGVLDLNGKDITVDTHLRIQNGGPASVRGLGGRTLTVGRSARFEGAAGTLLSLRGAALWSIAVNDTLAASRVELQNSKALTGAGRAIQSVDGGGNLNWTFVTAGAPVILAHPQPKSYLVGQAATLKVSADGGGQAMTFQWRKGDQPLADQRDSVFSKANLALADNGSYACAVGNASGTAISQAAALSVAFPAPVAQPGSTGFADSVVVRISPPVPSAKVFVSIDQGTPALLTQDLVLRATASVTAFATLGGDTSQIGAWQYAKTPLEAPAATPRGRRFADTVRIALGTRTPDARIYYTLDGRAPDTASLLYREPFLLDSTAVLKAVSAKDGRVSGETLAESYELVPDSLSASPRGGDYPGPVTVSLASTSRRAALLYTRDGSDPGPDNPASLPYTGGIRLETNTILKAVAVAGQGATLRVGRVLTESYAFIQSGARSLAAGETVDISNRYSVSNPRTGAPAVALEIKGPDSLKAVWGFRDIQFALAVSLPANASGFPELVFTAPSGEERALYRMTPAGKVEFLSQEDIVQLPGPGTYFLGVDTLPPHIDLNGETFQDDSTQVVFSVQDNVINLSYDLERSDAPARNLSARELPGTAVITVKMKPPKAWDPLWIRLRVRDGRNTQAFPADAASEYHLSRKSDGPLASPSVFRIGAKADAPWDMVSFPLEAQGKITLGALKSHNAVTGLTARVWDPASERPRVLRDDEPLPAGAAVWMGSSASAGFLNLPPFRTAARQGKETWQVTLKRGWNQVANPSLRPLIWPFNRGALGYPNSVVKGLHGFNPLLPDEPYFPTDTLLPWRGYFVLNKGSKDTTITLRTTPVPPAQASPAAAGGSAPKRGLIGAGALGAYGPASTEGFSLVLGLDRLSPLRLGASPASEDGLGVEDEPRPPALKEDGPRLWSARGRSRLGTDYLRWSPGALLAWTVIATRASTAAAPPSAPASAAAPSAGIPAGARVEDLHLPAGYALVAVSRARGLRFDLSEGGVIPILPGASDSLDIYAGPRQELEARLGDIPAAVEAFRLSARPLAGGYALDLALPQAATVRWTLRGLDGRSRDEAALTLGPGYYALPRKPRAGNLPAGAYLLRLEWTGGGHSGSIIRALPIP